MRALDKIDTSTLGGRIRYARVKRKLSQEEFGKKIHARIKTVSRWECGISIPTADYIAGICREFNVSADWLLGLKR
ncbi:MAG: helix-turn-helix transcriptional regulator [Clostridia bacterium]|nr:helix-turn-helix transcriptional regulator [Clostridia bacterium]MBQ2670811.1 helix-turn-helix transcriptional regulator [Clostridia bacterium]MBQ6531290.1 helix-turn-helix transcriptional regulator [Clostridia bacterium]MBQ9598591.1 helix-turn-helix transcriptional regulator [Clostridia bacterium]MBR0470096.1 helix-turn-helix transcriptional regulator [Clostridia bacterium]